MFFLFVSPNLLTYFTCLLFLCGKVCNIYSFFGFCSGEEQFSLMPFTWWVWQMFWTCCVHRKFKMTPYHIIWSYCPFCFHEGTTLWTSPLLTSFFSLKNTSSCFFCLSSSLVRAIGWQNFCPVLLLPVRVHCRRHCRKPSLTHVVRKINTQIPPSINQSSKLHELVVLCFAKSIF